MFKHIVDIRTTEDLLILATVDDFGIELVFVTLVGQRDVVTPYRYRRAELH